MVPAAISSTPCLFISAVYPPGSPPRAGPTSTRQVQHVLVKRERRSCGTPPFSGTAWSCQAWHGLTRRQLVARAGQSLQFVAADAGWHIDGVHRLVDFGLAIRRARPIAGFESFLAAAAIVAIRPHELDADVRRHLPPIVTTRVRPACSVTDCGSSGLSMGLPEPTEVALPLSVQRQAPTVVFQAVFACYRLEIAFAECGANIRQAHVLGGLGR